MDDKNRAFPTEINRIFVYLGQILFHCNLGFTHVFEYVPKRTRNPSNFYNFLRKQVTLGRVVCGAGSFVLPLAYVVSPSQCIFYRDGYSVYIHDIPLCSLVANWVACVVDLSPGQ